MRKKPRHSVGPKHAPRASKWKPPFIFLSLLCLLALFWLVYEKAPIDIKAWINNEGQWGTSEAPAAHPSPGAGSSGLQENNINASLRESQRELPYAQEPETKPESPPEPVLSAQPESPTVLAPELQPEPVLKPELEPEAEPEVVSQNHLLQPELGSEDLELATVRNSPKEQLTPSATPQSLQVVFGFDSTSLSTEGKASLDALAQKFLASGVSRLRVTGYADEHGDREYNLDLSRRRAEAVAQYLVASGIDAGRLFVRGQGIYSNAGESDGTMTAGQAAHGRIVRVDVEVN